MGTFSKRESIRCSSGGGGTRKVGVTVVAESMARRRRSHKRTVARSTRRVSTKFTDGGGPLNHRRASGVLYTLVLENQSGEPGSEEKADR